MKHLLSILLMVFICSAVYSQTGSVGFFSPGEYSVEELRQVNTDKSDICPFFVDGELFYSSQDERFYSNSRLRKNKAFYNIYKKELQSNGVAVDDSTLYLVSGFGEEYHEGPASYCKATGEMFVTKSNVVDPEIKRSAFTKENIRLRLVVMKQVNGKWKETGSFPYNDSRYHYAHPAISASGDTLIFSSDMPGGYGNSDLYMSVREKGRWTNPQNLGEKVNTAGNEMFPTFLSNNVLSFASDGLVGGNGKFDIWYVNFPLSGKVMNAGLGINSEGDDFGLVICPGKSMGYFSSDRQGGKGSDDIYLVKKNKYEVRLITKSKLTKKILPETNVNVCLYDGTSIITDKTGSNGVIKLLLNAGEKYKVFAGKKGYKEAEEIIDLTNMQDCYTKEVFLGQEYLFKGIVLDKTTGQPVKYANVDVGGQGFTANEEGAFFMNISPDAVYDFTISAQSYVDLDKSVSTAGISPGIVTEVFELIPFLEGVRFELDNIFYDFDKWNIRPDAAAELDKLVKLLKQYPDVNIKLESHTDCRGTDSYNMKLSERRAKSCFRYIVARGISAERIKCEWFGESRLVNRCDDGVNCSEDEHQQNRRTMIENLKSDY